MRRIRFLLLILLSVSWCHVLAQTMSVESFRLLENDLTANTFGTIKYDANGNAAALIKVVTTENGFNFDLGSTGVVATSQKKGEIWVYVPGGVQRITITHSQLGDLRDYYFPIPIERARTYELKLLSGSLRTVVMGDDVFLYGSLEIDSDPINCNIWLDDEFIGQTPFIKKEITAGKHKILMQKEGYSLKQLEIFVDPGKLNSHVISLLKSEERGHAYVDLGLSVKWATCNVGAETPEQLGYYYAWGEVQNKTEYTWGRYRYCEGSYLTLTKYCDVSGYGQKDDRTVLGIADDVAAINWKGGWRMPTIDEFQELMDSCIWTWTTMNSVNGCLIKGKKTGYSECSIFLPAAGYRTEAGLRNAYEVGAYWSSQLGENGPNYAYGIYISSQSKGQFTDFRSYGLSIRPVCP